MYCPVKWSVNRFVLRAHSRRAVRLSTMGGFLWYSWGVACRRSRKTGEDDHRTSGITISEVRVQLSS
jgi:hypothetical protein